MPNPSPSPTPHPKGDILVVDDNADNLRLLSVMLSEQGYKVRKVIKGELTFDIAQLNPPDLILLDIFMPTIDGFEVCRQLKTNPRTQAIPIIFLSASGEPLDKVKAFDVGGEDYITKPFAMSEVVVRIEHQLRLVRLQQQMQAQNQQLQAEVADRLKAEAALQQINNELEERVQQRTAELTHTNQQLNQLGQKLQQSLAQEQALNHFKSQIITTISHEYRTPMAIISSSTGILEDYFDQLSVDLRRKHLSRIQGAIQRILSLVDDVILFNKLEFEAFKPSRVCVDLPVVINSVVAEINRIHKTSHTILTHTDAACTQPTTDANLIHTIVTNLLTNAIKFSPAGSTLEITLNCTGDHFLIAIQDPGIGIPREEVSHIFDPFFRASNAGHVQGVGMGLALVKKCVDLLAGRIDVHSQVESGTTVTVLIPYCP
jgi:two-component system, sensor histidine kinase and response regulator